MIKFGSGVLILFLSLIILTLSCQKEEDSYWNLDMSAPLLKTRIDLTDILADSLVVSDCQNHAVVVLNEELYRFDPAELFDTKQDISDNTYKMPFSLQLQPGQKFISTTENVKFDFGDAEIRFMDADKGSVKIVATNTLSENIVCFYKIPKVQRNNLPFSARIEVPAASGGIPGKGEIIIDVSDYKMDLRGSNSLSYNRLDVKIEAMIDSAANAVMVTPNDSMVLNATFIDLGIAYARGYFGQDQFKIGPASSKIDVFDYFTEGTLAFERAYADIIFENGFGVDLKVNLGQVEAENSKTGQKVALTDNFIGNNVNVGRALEKWSPDFEVVPVYYPFKTDSNTIRDMINILPDKMNYELDVMLNPLGNISNGNDFFYKEYPLRGIYELSIPLWLQGEDLKFEDVIKIHFDEKTINKGNLYLIVNNSFPFDAEMQLIMRDKNKNIIDSLAMPKTIPSGTWIAGETIAAKKTVHEIIFDEDRMDILRDVRYIDVITTISTNPAGEAIKLRTWYYMDVIISANFEMEVGQ